MTKRLILLMVLLVAVAQGATLISVSPSSGAVGTAVIVTVSGAYWWPGPVTVNPISGITFSYGCCDSGIVQGGNASAYASTWTIASNATLGARTVTVHTPNGDTNSMTFTVLPPVPTLSSIGPTSGLSGTTVPITLTGTNLTGATIYAMTGITIQSVVSSSTTVTANFVIAAGASAGARIVAVNTAGGTSGNVTFTVTAPNPVPTLSSVSPSTGKAGTSVPVTISGTGFVGYTVNLPSGITYTNLSGGSTSATLTLNIAAGKTPGSYSITFSNNGGTSNGVTFTVTPAFVSNTRRVILVN